MPLTHIQKNYIRKNIRKEDISLIAQKINADKGEILDYLKKRWGEEKFQKFINKSIISQQAPSEKKSHDWFKNHWIPILILFFLIMATYANSLTNEFVSDDIAEIAKNPSVGHFSYIFTHPFGFIRLILNWMAYQIGGLTPIFFRLINVFFHSGNVILIYILFNLLYSSRKLGFIVAAIFAVHPAISEAVVWISGGTYPQYTFFFLLSFLFYILSTKRKFFYLLSSIFYLLSLMSHPVMPLALFLVFPLYEFVFGDLRKNWLKATPYFLLSIAYIFINLGALPERTTTLQSVHYQERGVDNIFLLVPIAISSYFELIFYPAVLTLYHSELVFGIFQYGIMLFIIAVSIATVIFFKRNKSILFWLIFSLLALSPTLTPFRLNWVVAERYLYLPSLGIFALVGIGLLKFRKYQQVVIFLFALVLIALSARTILRNIDWKNEDNLWIATGKTSPSSPNNHNNLGDVYGRQGDKQRALQEFQTAIILKPDYGDAYHNLANTYRELSQLDKALENYQNALRFNPNLWQSHQNIAAIYFQAGQYEQALENIQKAITINPKNLNLQVNLGVVYLGLGQKDKAKEIFTAILSIDPQNQIAKQGLVEASK
ncbi:MAG: tetratricopeptide repeat protein [Candidatus Daviesbacteria bacterium]|nr:tetratricopeptide repeat protein [Candidatus Daviesbacteria bacterium]